MKRTCCGRHSTGVTRLHRPLRHAILRHDTGRYAPLTRNYLLRELANEPTWSVSNLAESPLEGDVLARCATVQGYAGATDRPTVRALLAAMGDSEPMVRWEAAVALAESARNLEKPQVLQRVLGKEGEAPLTRGELLAWLRQSLATADAVQREAVADALGHWPQQGAVELLIKALDDDAAPVRASAALSLGRLGAIDAVERLSAALGDPSLRVRIAAAEALGAIGAVSAAPALAEMVAQGPTLTRVAAISGLGRLPSREAQQALIACLTDQEGEVRWHAARGLEQIGTAAALLALERLLGDTYCLFGQPVHAVAQAAIRAIRQREQGAGHAVRHAFYRLWGWLRRLRLPEG